MSNFDFDSLMKQAQQMQNEMMRIQGELSETIYTGNRGGSEGVTVKIEVVDIKGGEFTRKGGEDVPDRDLHHFRLDPIDFQIQLRGLRVKEGHRLKGLGEFLLVHLEFHRVFRRVFGKLLRGDVTGPAKHCGDPARHSESHNRRWGETENPRVRNLVTNPLDFRQNRAEF